MLYNEIHTLEIDSVELSFGERMILNNVYLKIETGRISALLGRNGSGKSCLMKIIFGELKPTYKSMRIDSAWHKEFTNKQVLYLPQYCSIPKKMSVKTLFRDFNLCYDDFADTFPDLAHLESHKIGMLSGGESRILEIYTILKSNSLFAILDEPFSQVMPLHVTTIKKLILEAKTSKGILITDHMYKNVIDMSDSLYVINDQTVYSVASPDDLVKYGYINHIII